MMACATVRDRGARDAMDAFMADLNALNYDGIVGHYADDATAFFPVVKAERADGEQAIAQVFRDYVAGNTKKTNIVPEELRVQEYGDVAIVTFIVHNPSAISRRTFVWHHSGKGWKIVHMHASNIPTRGAASP